MWNIMIALTGIWLVSSVEPPYQSPEELTAGDDISPPLRLWQTEMETMVDLTNNLGVAILKDHSYSRGNFAFSPYGVASVLVVLYEGATGESAVQIQRAFGFPWNKDAIRVGFAEIHRHLRSYFSHEGYLSGISLNRDQSSLKPDFKKILRIYGYDVELDDESMNDVGSQDGSSSSGNETATVPTTPPSATEPQNEETATEIQSTTELNSEQANETTIPPATTTTTSNEHTSNTSATTTTEEPSTTTLVTTTTREEKNPNPQTTTPREETSTQSETTVEVILLEYTTKPTEQTELTEQPEHIEQTEPTEQPEHIEQTEPTEQTAPTERTKPTEQTKPTERTKPTEPTETTERTKSTEQTKPTEGTVEEIVPPTSQPPENILVDINNRFHISLTIDAECSTRRKRTGENCPTGDVEEESKTLKTVTNHQHNTLERENNEIAKLDNKMLIPQAEDNLNLSPSGSTRTQTSNRKSRKVRSLATAVGAKSAIEMSGISKREVSNIRKILSRKVPLWTAPEPRKPKVRKPRTITDYLRQPETRELSLQLQNGMYDTHISRNDEVYQNLPRKLFLVDGAIETPVPMMSYTYIFPYAYVPNLHAKAMEFPLDDTRYKLLILLPVEERGLRQLIYDLMGYPLRNVLDSMRPAKVKATIPTFMVEGFVILTSSLKKLGILDVFDPRKANLSGMSVDPELYVRNVEQSVTVVIRNYVEILDIETRTTAARYIDYNFEATHPFLYFVLDTATNVALMTGQILDPLNSRIY